MPLDVTSSHHEHTKTLSRSMCDHAISGPCARHLFAPECLKIPFGRSWGRTKSKDAAAKTAASCILYSNSLKLIPFDNEQNSHTRSAPSRPLLGVGSCPHE